MQETKGMQRKAKHETGDKLEDTENKVGTQIKQTRANEQTWTGVHRKRARKRQRQEVEERNKTQEEESTK